MLVEKLGAPSSFLRQTLEELLTFGHTQIAGERAVRTEAVHAIWSPICGAREAFIDLKGKDKGITRFTSTKKRFLDFVEDNSDRDWA